MASEPLVMDINNSRANSFSFEVAANNSVAEFVVQTISNPASIKLDKNNFLPWRQVIATVRRFKLQKFLLGKK